MNRSSGCSHDSGYLICSGDEPLLEAPALRLSTGTTALPDSCQPPASRSHTAKWPPEWASICLAGDHSGSPLMLSCSWLKLFRLNDGYLHTNCGLPSIVDSMVASSSAGAASSSPAPLLPMCAVFRDDVDTHGKDCSPSHSWRLIAWHRICGGFGSYPFCIDVFYHPRVRPRWL
jgi:hypothetical protein